MNSACLGRRWWLCLSVVLFHAPCLAAGQCGPWQWSNPWPQGNVLEAVAFSQDSFVAVGLHGTVLTSTDGDEWNLLPRVTNEDLNDVAWGAGRFVAVGNRGTALSSSDGRSWAVAETGTFRDLKAVAFNGYFFLVVSESGIVLTSADGEHWQNHEVSPMDPESLTWGGGLFVATWENRILTSYDGLDWTEVVDDSAEPVHDVAYNGDVFVAVGGSGVVWISEDGANWEQHHAGTSRALHAIIWDFDRFVAVGRIGVILTSFNSTDWERRESESNSHLHAVAFGAGVYVAVGNSGTIINSPFARDWTVVSTFDPTASLVDVVWTGDEFVALPGRVEEKKATSKVYTSTDSLTWQEWSLGTSEELSSLACSPVRCTAVGEQVTLSVALGSDGAWQQSYHDDVFFEDVIWDGSHFVAVGATDPGGETVIMRSVDGMAWFDASPPASVQLYGVANGGGRWVAVGSDGAVYVSVDGAAWHAYDSGSPKTFSAVAWTGQYFVGVGERSLLAISEDGEQWTIINPPKAHGPGKAGVVTFTDVAASDSKVLVVGHEGSLVTSSDGQSWLAEQGPVSAIFGAAVHDGQQFVVVGEDGIVLRSACPLRMRRGGRILP